MNKELYISELRQAVAEFNQAMMKLREAKRKWGSQDLGNVLVQNDLQGDNVNLLVDDLVNVITTVAAVESLLTAGHATNMDRVARF